MDQHRRTTAVAVLIPTAASDDDDSHFNAAIAAAVYIAVTTAVAAAITIEFAAAFAAVLALSAAITVVVNAAVAATTAAAAAADAAATTPSPLPPLSLSLQPPPTSLCLRRSCGWLVVVSSVAPRLLRRTPSKFVSPCHRAVVDAFFAGRCLLLLTIAIHCPVAILPSINRLCRSH